jgi:hypothetical protein
MALSVADFMDAMGQSESSNNYSAQRQNNDKRKRRFVGKYQFGKDRLTDYKRANKEQFTMEEFIGDPELQERVMEWQVRDIDRAIDELGEKAEGFDRDGLRAVAHLGGVNGMRSYVKTRGGYNPQDEEKTSLSEYYNKFKTISRQIQDPAAPDQSPMPMPRPGDVPTGLLNISEAPIADPASQVEDLAGMLAMAGAEPAAAPPAMPPAMSPAGSPAMAILGGGVAPEGTSLDRLGAPKVRITKARTAAPMPTQMPMPDQTSLAKRMMLALSGRQSPLEQARAGMLLRDLQARKR